MKWLHSKKGFTLIELMIVILIIAILVAIAVPVYLAATKSAQKRTCQSNLRTIDSAINAYNGYHEAWPPDGPVGTELGSTWLKRNPTCPSVSETYDLSGGSTIVPPETKCPGTVPGHSI